MSTDQLQIFEPSRSLADVPLEQRMAAVERLLAADPGMCEEERWQLLGLAISPQVFGAVES
jgi:hypothetical protein